MVTGIGDGLVVLCAFLATACVAAYQWTTRGAWWQSEVGRHLMAFMASIWGVLTLSAARVVAVDVLHSTDPNWFQVTRLVVLASVPLVLLWRLWLIVTVDPGSDRPLFWRH